MIAGVGVRVIAPAGIAHLAWNPTEAPVHLRVRLRPALRWEEFIEELFALASSGGPSRADELARLVRAFPEEIAPTTGEA